jgi:hypothetical protein
MPVMPSLSDLLDRLTQLEERTSKAEERAARAEARAAQLENTSRNLGAAVVNPSPISRRSLLTKVAAAGAAGVAGSLILAKPKDVFASFTWTGGAANVADLETLVTAASGYTNPAVLQLDANATANPSNNADGLRTFGSGTFSGTATYGGNKGGIGVYAGGGPGAAGVNQAGPGLLTFSGQNYAGGGAFNYAAEIFGNGASDGSAQGNGLYSSAAGSFGYNWLLGAPGTGTTSTNHVNGGTALFAYGGPGATAVQAIGGGISNNPALAAHGVRGVGNVLGVGGYFQGGRAQVQIIPNAGAGAPTSGPHFAGDLYMDGAEVIWVCIATGTPGTFAPLQPGGMNNALFTAVSTSQYPLVSDGVTWIDMDAANLKLTITPTYNCQAILTASADLFTSAAGYNQDIGISVSGGAYPTTAGQPEGWKESGGYAGTFSPNAAHVDTIVPLAAGTAYTVKIVWKANKPASGHAIYAGAGPIGGKFSPTRLTAWLVPTNPGGTIPRVPEKPYVHDVPQLRGPSADPYGRNSG